MFSDKCAKIWKSWAHLSLKRNLLGLIEKRHAKRRYVVGALQLIMVVANSGRISAERCIYRSFVPPHVHGWPQLELSRKIGEENPVANRALLVPFQFLLVPPPLCAVWIAGLRQKAYIRTL